MNFINDIEPCTSTRIIRTADGGINYEHYRIAARRRRGQAMADLFGLLGVWLRERVSGLRRRRVGDANWQADRAHGM